MNNLTPREIVSELDRYIVGQDDAKRAVAVAVRNRWRRMQLPQDVREDVIPKNILMFGPTGVGKTEIARRLAALTGAPFLKVEASRYTEVGYHGRDVESMVRDIVKVSANMVKARRQEEVRVSAESAAEERLLDVLLPMPSSWSDGPSAGPDAPMAGAPPPGGGPAPVAEPGDREKARKTREKLRKKLRAGELDGRDVEIDVGVSSEPLAHLFTAGGAEEMGLDFKETMDKYLPKRSKRRRLTVRDARNLFIQEESSKLIDEDDVIREAVVLAEQHGIIFVDEIDKIAGSRPTHGPDVSREGVQRDLLPVVEGTTVATRYGMVRTNHMLFIAAGAFHSAKPDDLIPELQGRFPIRVELKDLSEGDFVRILTDPKTALTKQAVLLMATEGVTLSFNDGAVRRMAALAAQANRTSQNIGARRLYTVMEKLLEDLSFRAPDLSGQSIVIEAPFVDERLAGVIRDENLSRYVL
jgi:ATP-dependent HslUV protease ATP-binding subunit HslU